MGYKNFWNSLNRNAHKVSRYFWFKREYKSMKRRYEAVGIRILKLSAAQKRQVRQVWGGLSMHDYSTHEMVYSITGHFDPHYCSILVFGSHLEFILNDDVYKRSWSDKNFFDRYFSDVRFPRSILHNVQGILYDRNYNKISVEEAMDMLLPYERVVIKPSLDTTKGRGVKLLSVAKDAETVLRSDKRDYLIQELVVQWAPLKALNPTSVNIIRLNSLFINGEVTYLSATLRVGAPGAFTDNGKTADGKGITVIGVTEDGRVKDHGYYFTGERVDTLPSGAPFAGLEIPNFEQAKVLAKKIHSQMPFAKYVGFDIAFDEDGQPVVIEYNLDAPGAFYYQLVNGPLFGERTEELIKTLT